MYFTLMANMGDARQSLLPVSSDHPHRHKGDNALKKKNIRRCATAPLRRLAFTEQNFASQSNPCTNAALPENRKLDLRQVCVFFVAYLGLGSFCFFLIRHQIKGKKTNGILDAAYFCVVTMTTVGYGDLVPDTALAKLLACVFVFTGMAFIGLILSNAADYIVEKQELLLVKAMHLNEKVPPGEIMKEAESNRVKYKLLMALSSLVVLKIIGVVFLVLVEKLEFIDAFYCVCSTMTTLGYGDESFSTGIGRMFAVIWIPSGTICLAQIFLYLAELSTERRQSSLVKLVLKRNMTASDLEDADLDHDYAVSPAEFILFKLKEMGKISKEDISLLMERFKDLDVDHSGALTATDLILAQSP